MMVEAPSHRLQEFFLPVRGEIERTVRKELINDVLPGIGGRPEELPDYPFFNGILYGRYEISGHVYSGLSVKGISAAEMLANRSHF